MYRAKSYTSVFLAGMFLFVRSLQTLLLYRMHRLATKRTTKKQVEKKRELEFSPPRVCTVL